MASLQKKRKKGRDYYYIMESCRINGKPRILNQVYLGTVEKILENHESVSAPSAREVGLTRFGPMALWDVAVSLNLPNMIDEAFPKKSKKGPPISQYMLLAALGRAFAPCSKVKIGEWYENSTLKRIWGIKKEKFSSQNFWNNMDMINLDRLTELEKEIYLHVAKEEKLKPKALFYDTTNYYTYIDTLNERNQIAQRGKGKQKRNDLRQLGLALAVTPDFHIPLFHTLYPGNINDITQFKTIFDDLTDRIKDLTGNSNDLTLVFDKGNVSEEILFYCADQDIYIIVANPSSRDIGLDKIELEKLYEVDSVRLPGVNAWRGKKEIVGKEWTIVIEHSATFAVRQYQSLATAQAKAIIKLEDLSRRLRRGEMPKTNIKKIEKKASAIISSQYLKKVIEIKVFVKNKRPVLNYSLLQKGLENLMNYRFGRTILITNRDELSNADIILGYRGQSEVERIFQESKDTDHLSFRPPYHWTDQKLHVHAFYCTLALMLTGVLRRRLNSKGISIPTIRLLEELNNLREATLFYPPSKKGPPRIAHSKVSQNATQKELFEALNLSHYLRQTKKKVKNKGKKTQ